jgi:hypothetical protein
MPTHSGLAEGFAMKFFPPPAYGPRTAGRRKASSWPRSPVCSERVATADAGAIPAHTAATRSQSHGFADRLWREHDVLASQLARLESAADVVGNEELPLSALRSELDRAYELLAEHIVPHMRSADEYQKALTRRDYVSAPARPEHEEAERLTSKLARVRDRVSGDNISRARRETRRLLYELHALTRPHFGDRRDLQA